MTVLVLRRALADYARRPLNVVLLVAVPLVIVVALSGELAAFSKLLSTTAKPLHLQVATAGWAAAAVAGLAGFFQAVGSRDADRRLAAASARGATPVVIGRVLAAASLASAAGAASLASLAAKGGIADPARVIPAIVLVAVLYVAIGVVVGTWVRSEMNGALVVSVIWMLDVFVGSGLGGSSSLVTRVFPLHFPTMILTDQAAHHGGPISDVGWSAVWAVGLVALAVARLSSTTRPARRAKAPNPRPPASAERGAAEVSVALATAARRSPDPASRRGQSSGRLEPVVRSPGIPAARWAAGLWADAREYRRNRVLWVLLVAVPVLFVALAAEQTPTTRVPVTLVEGARQLTAMLSMRQIHAGEMASISSALLAGIAGLFVVTGSAAGDRRLVLAGFRPRQVLAGHLGVIAAAAAITSAVSLAVSAAFVSPSQWLVYAGADLLVALTYAMIGVLLGPLVGRLGGLYLLLLLAIVDPGYGQTVMFHPLPPSWGAFLPGRGAGKLLLDGSFASGFAQYGYLLLALAWLAGLTAAALFVFRHEIGARRAVRARPVLPAGRAGFPHPVSVIAHSPGSAVRPDVPGHPYPHHGLMSRHAHQDQETHPSKEVAP